MLYLIFSYSTPINIISHLIYYTIYSYLFIFIHSDLFSSYSPFSLLSFCSSLLFSLLLSFFPSPLLPLPHPLTHSPPTPFPSSSLLITLHRNPSPHDSSSLSSLPHSTHIPTIWFPITPYHSSSLLITPHHSLSLLITPHHTSHIILLILPIPSSFSLTPSDTHHTQPSRLFYYSDLLTYKTLRYSHSHFFFKFYIYII